MNPRFSSPASQAACLIPAQANGLGSPTRSPRRPTACFLPIPFHPERFAQLRRFSQVSTRLHKLLQASTRLNLSSFPVQPPRAPTFHASRNLPRRSRTKAGHVSRIESSHLKPDQAKSRGGRPAAAAVRKRRRAGIFFLVRVSFGFRISGARRKALVGGGRLW